MKILRNITLYILGFGVPLLFLPNIFAEAFGLPKFIFLILGVCVLLLIWAYNVFQTNTLHWRPTPFDVPLLALAVAYLLSTFIASPNKIATLTSSGGSGVVLLLVLLYFLIVQTAEDKGQTFYAVKGLTFSAVLISLWTGINFVMELANLKFQIFNFQFPLTNLSPLGSMLTQEVFLLIMLAFAGYKFVVVQLAGSRADQDRSLQQILRFVIPLVILLGLFATGYKLTQSSPFPLLPYKFGWAIALDSFKNAPVFGIGPDNFISAFTRFKPLAINQTDYWNVTFGVSSNWYFQVLTTVGVLGLAAYLFLVWKVWKNKNNGLYKARSATLTTLAVLALQLFVPFNLPLLFTEFVVLSGLGIALSAPAAAIRLVTVREGLVSVDTGEEQVVESWEEVEVKEE